MIWQLERKKVYGRKNHIGAQDFALQLAEKTILNT
jgi:hypothetical protein